MQEKKQSATVSYENLDRIGEIALYYGFFPRQSPTITKIDLDRAKSLIDSDTIDDEEEGKIRLPLHVEEKAALLRMYEEQNMQNMPQPVMFYFKEPFHGSVKNLHRRDIAIWRSSEHLVPSPKRRSSNQPASFWPKRATRT